MVEASYSNTAIGHSNDVYEDLIGDGTDSDSLKQKVKDELIEQIESQSLEKLLSKYISVDLLDIVELKHSEVMSQSQELRKEVLSFIEICFDNMGFDKMYVKFPKHNFTAVKNYMKKQGPVISHETL